MRQERDIQQPPLRYFRRHHNLALISR